MPDLPAPSAARLQRSRWLDPRLVVGVLLVCLSVALGARVVAAADTTVEVWALTRDIGPGATLGDADLELRHVRLDSGLDRYVAAAGNPAGHVLTRPVGGGELLPRAALAAPGEAELRRLPIGVDRVGTTGLEDGAVVDVYVVPESAPGAGSTTGTSSLVLDAVTVEDVSSDGGSGLGAGTRAAAVVLLVTPAEAQRVLDAQARGVLRLLHVRSGPTEDAHS